MDLSLFSKAKQFNLRAVIFVLLLFLSSLETIKAAEKNTSTIQDIDTIDQLDQQALIFWSPTNDQFEDNEATEFYSKNWLYFTITLVCILLIIILLLTNDIRQKHRINHILKETNAFFEEQNTVLEASNHFKEQLISLVAHDVRHSIASLQKVLSLFEKEHLSSAEIQRLMSSSRRDVISLIRLLDDLLLWVSLQLKYKQLQKTRFYIQDVLQSVVELYQQKARDKNIQLIVEQTTNMEIYADKEAIATVIRNLIDNGIKFSNPGGYVYLRTASIADNRRMVIHISDKGIGMSEETIENLFLKPSYARRYGTHNEEGSGLGIQICMHYLHLNNSALFVESDLGQGTRFWFELESVPAAHN